LRCGRGAEWFLAKNSGNRLIWFCDVDLLLRKEMDRIQWADAAARCRAWNVEADVAASLAVLALVLPASSAAEAMNRLGLEPPAGRAAAADRWLVRLSSDPMFASAMSMNRRVQFRPARLLILGQLFFPPRRELASFYKGVPGWMVPLLYMVHPAVMAIRQLRG
jgi:hypothetical protein